MLVKMTKSTTCCIYLKKTTYPKRFFLKPVRETYINELNCNKALGRGNITPRLLNETKDHNIVTPLSSVIDRVTQKQFVLTTLR